MTLELVSTFLERESFEVLNIFYLHMIKKKKKNSKATKEMFMCETKHISFT